MKTQVLKGKEILRLELAGYKTSNLKVRLRRVTLVQKTLCKGVLSNTESEHTKDETDTELQKVEGQLH